MFFRVDSGISRFELVSTRYNQNLAFQIHVDNDQSSVNWNLEGIYHNS